MGAAYSQDLRDRVISAVASGEFSQREVAERLHVSVGYVESVMRRYRQTGSRAAKAWNAGRLRVLRAHQDWLRSEVSQTPDGDVG